MLSPSLCSVSTLSSGQCYFCYGRHKMWDVRCEMCPAWPGCWHWPLPSTAHSGLSTGASLHWMVNKNICKLVFYFIIHYTEIKISSGLPYARQVWACFNRGITKERSPSTPYPNPLDWTSMVTTQFPSPFPSHYYYQQLLNYYLWYLCHIGRSIRSQKGYISIYSCESHVTLCQ